MKKHIKGVLIITFAFFAVALQAQKSEIGINTGYGRSAINSEMELVSPFSSDINYLDFYRVGLSYSLTPIEALCSLEFGLNYETITNDGLNIDFFQVPVGVEFQIGKSVQFLIGGGLYISYMISNDAYSDSKGFDANKFQVGFYGNSGVGFWITEKSNLSIKYNYFGDITNIYEETNHSPGGALYKTGKKTYDSFITLCLKFKL